MSEKAKFEKYVYTGVVNGKKTKKHVRAQTEKELQQKIREIENAVAEGKDVHSNATFGYWADRWYSEKKEPAGLAPKTLSQCRAAIDHLKREFADTEFRSIHASDFQKFINDYSITKSQTTGKVPAKRTIYSVIHTYNAIAQYALESDIPGAKPYKNVTVSKNAPAEKRRALTEQEINWIVDTEHKMQLPAMVLTFSGLRLGEFIPLQWSDIDLTNGVIHVRRFAYIDGSQYVLKDDGKTVAARRKVPIPPVLVDYLRQYRDNEQVTSILVFPKEGGGMHSPSSFRDNWNRYIEFLNLKYYFGGRDKWDVLKELNGGVSRYKVVNGKRRAQWKVKTVPLYIYPFTPYYCRHTFATLLFLQGIDVTTAMQYMGHTQIQTTIGIYTDTENYYSFDLSNDFKEKLETVYHVKTA